MKNINHLALGAALTLLVGGASAADMVNNYVDGMGGVVKNASGECWRTSYQDTDKKLEECGYPAPVAEDVVQTSTDKLELVASPTAASLTTTVEGDIQVTGAMLFGFE